MCGNSAAFYSEYLVVSYEPIQMKDATTIRCTAITRTLTEEIKLKISGFSDLTIFRKIGFIYPRDNLFEILGTQVKTCLKCTGNPVKNVCNFGKCDNVQLDFLCWWFDV